MEDRKERDDFHKRIAGEMNSRFDKVCEVLETKTSKDSSAEIEKLKAEVDKLRKMKSSSLPSSSGATSAEDDTARRLRELEEFRRKTQEDAERRVSALEEEVVLLRRLHEHATNEAATWKHEALHPGNKRGCVVIEESPSVHARVRPRCTPMKTPAVTAGRSAEENTMADVHRKEVQFLKELHSRDLNGRRIAELEVKRLKEGKEASQLEIERLKRELAKMNMGMKETGSKGTNLKTKLDEAANDSARRAEKGKQPTSMSKQAARANNKEGFMMDARRTLQGLKKDDIKAICDKEGVAYTTLDRTKEEIVLQCAAKAFESTSNQATINVISEETEDVSADVAHAGDYDANS
ncbi:hypothetical protein CBR_g8515 [Chara braunii]|uniref:Uncharacterized protein n=1 Tax=Chara braunii TaxID=69332 RepID=A0A388KME0_CHABU|nr:hypothetical protein CBR_g8515 [Chara braunii]|eukprot:GBG71212.1 hypothetical protein CBR_g8515 [Chara braunii]